MQLRGATAKATFGGQRHINQRFYKSREWLSVRDKVIARDNGCDLGVEGYEIHSELLVHHMNPMELSDLVNWKDYIVDPDFLITTTQATHNLIHFGDETTLAKPFAERQPGDTKLW